MPAGGSLNPVGILGTKAHGLLALPEAWTVPEFVVVPTYVIAEVLGGRRGLDEAIRVALATMKAPFGDGACLIVRSSSSNEDLAARGRYHSAIALDEEELLRAAREVVDSFRSAGETDGAALLVHRYFRAQQSGHISNERRISRRVRDFVAEAWGASPEDSNPETYTLQSKKAVRSADAARPLILEADLANCLRSVARWTHRTIGRAHMEWVVSGGKLLIVQCDIEDEKQYPAPMADWKCESGRIDLAKLQLFRTAEQVNTTTLRKTRSLDAFRALALPAAPLYLLRDRGVFQSLLDGEVPRRFDQDLAVLLAFPLVIRVDVELDLGVNWHNLPASGPLRDVEAATAFVLSSLRQVVERGVSLDQAALVAHHFIPARAAAWVECHPATGRARIDSTWGHPDGLQTFPCDTSYMDLTASQQFVHGRHKDEFLDVDANGKCVRRRSGQPWDNEPSISAEEAAHVAESTMRVANHLRRPVRVMWFLKTDGRAGLPKSVPWILVDDLEGVEDVFLEGKAGSPKAPLAGTTTHARRLALGRVRKIEDEQDLADFERDPRPFDLGGQRVVFRPTTKLIREKWFLAAVGKAASARSWRVVLEGSKLAHNWYLLRSSGVDVESSADYLAVPKRRRIFDKLVRDKVPGTIQAQGEVVSAMELPNRALRAALRRKLVEEALEVANAEGEQAIVDELADAFEVILALQRNLGLSSDEIERRAEKKRNKRGGFDRGLFLRSTGGDKSEDAPTRRDYVRLERKGKALQIVVPLVPPPSGASPDVIRLKIAQLSLTITASYDGDHASLRFSSARPIEEDRQLSLFGPDEDELPKA
ncbi:MAG: hypothetical protein ACOY0T_15850 [Myxococcota bacterium]